MLLMSSSLLHKQYAAYLICLAWIVCVMGEVCHLLFCWVFCFQDFLFKESIPFLCSSHKYLIMKKQNIFLYMTIFCFLFNHHQVEHKGSHQAAVDGKARHMDIRCKSFFIRRGQFMSNKTQKNHEI